MNWRLKGDDIANHPSHQKREFVNFVNYNQKQRNILYYFVPGIDSLDCNYLKVLLCKIEMCIAYLIVINLFI